MPIFNHFLMPPPGFEPGTFSLRVSGSTNRPLVQLIITILHFMYRFKDKMAFSSDYFNNKNNRWQNEIGKKSGENPKKTAGPNETGRWPKCVTTVLITKSKWAL